MFDYCQEKKLINGFDTNYGELYFAQDFEHIDYTSEELTRLSYLANLKNNFLQNRNLIKKTEQSLAQAERDFRYVLDIVPDHMFACMGLAEVMKQRNQKTSQREYLKKAREILEKDTGDWSGYINEMKLDIEELSMEPA